MANYRITAVRVEETTDDPHEHITAVKLGDSEYVFNLGTIVNDLRDPDGDRYHTYADGYRAEVYVRECPRCPFRNYITTTPDGTKENNLLKLPRFS